MAITSLRVAPEVAEVGVEVSCVPVGTPAGTERRYYLSSAPAASALDTLETYADDGLDLADIRLKQNGSGHGLFTPDVAGTYVVAVRDITVYRHVPHFGGDEPATGEATQVDNELAALDPYAGGTAQASDVEATFYAYQVLSRDIGFGQDTATLSLKVYGLIVGRNTLLDDPVILTPGATTAAKAATYSDLTQAALDHLRTGVAAGSTHQIYLTTHHTLLRYLVDAWNEHIARDGHIVHTNPDATNALTSTASVSATVGSIETRLDDIVAKYNAHRILTAGTVHAAADNDNVMSALLPCTTEAEAIDYYNHVYEEFYRHATGPSYHSAATSNTVVDGYVGWLAEPPTTLQEVADAINGTSTTRWKNYGLTSLYEAHRVRGVVNVHDAASGLAVDAVNGVYFLGGNLANLISTANAFAAALNRHIQNLDASNAAAGTPYHFADARRTRLVTGRAGDARSLAILIEELWLCFESHLWSGGPTTGYVAVTASGSTRGQHPDRAFGGMSLLQSDVRPIFLVRLQKAFDTSLSPDEQVTAALPSLADALTLRAGFS